VGTRAVCADNAADDIAACGAAIVFLQLESAPPGAFVTRSIRRASPRCGIPPEAR
jgi:hypothetical protein